jgi:hypothetical protein
MGVVFQLEVSQLVKLKLESFNILYESKNQRKKLKAKQSKSFIIGANAKNKNTL